MPEIINKVTGKKKKVSKEALKAIQSNPITKGLYDYKDTKEPEEVSKLKETKPEPQPPLEGGQAPS